MSMFDNMYYRKLTAFKNNCKYDIYAKLREKDYVKELLLLNNYDCIEYHINYRAYELLVAKSIDLDAFERSVIDNKLLYERYLIE